MSVQQGVVKGFYSDLRNVVPWNHAFSKPRCTRWRFNRFSACKQATQSLLSLTLPPSAADGPGDTDVIGICSE